MIPSSRRQRFGLSHRVNRHQICTASATTSPGNGIQTSTVEDSVDDSCSKSTGFSALFRRVRTAVIEKARNSR
ncbi:unnamed protein product [Zymoseptoria tritici ST99CH_3D7]|uniref:Uncharacterized protein n=1 Tax=Zymoseptoria tritici (strain ST99CH_3D7) TaxID=1276538 RepID=A0A1X7RRX0_ZYMT9|nr:unnamed protein product [Zymoseptoria tritici ST99CH_3D7]